MTPIVPGPMPQRRRSTAAASTMCRIGTPAACRIASYQPCAVLHGMAMAPQPARFRPAMPRSSQDSGSSPPARWPARAVGHARVRPQHGRDMVLVALGGREQGEPQHELGAGQRPHAAEHAEYFAVKSVRAHAVWSCGVPRAMRRSSLSDLTGHLPRSIATLRDKSAREDDLVKPVKPGHDGVLSPPRCFCHLPIPRYCIAVSSRAAIECSDCRRRNNTSAGMSDAPTSRQSANFS